MSEKIILKKQKLINLRKSLNMTQADFAKKAHISRTTYQSWENGLNNPTSHTFIALCQALGLDPCDYVENPNDLPKNSIFNIRNIASHLKESDRVIPSSILELINYWFSFSIEKQAAFEPRLNKLIKKLIYKLDDDL